MANNTLPPTVGLVLHFRGWQDTARCLQSLASDGVRRMVIVDNSQDAGQSLKELLPKLDELVEQDIDVVLLEPGRNLGFSAGVNQGLAEIRFRFGPACVLLINSDAVLQRDSHVALRRQLARHAGLVVPKICADGDRCGVGRAYYQVALGLLTKRRTPGSYAHFSGCCMLLSPQLASDPLFDEDFFFYGDDAELGWRLRARNVPQNCVEEASVQHTPSSSSKNGSLFYEYHMTRAHWLLAYKLADARLPRLVNILGRAATLPARALWRSIRMRSLTPIRGGLTATLDVASGRRRTLTPPVSDPNSTEGASNSRGRP